MSLNELQVGCLQRIASATELMAKSHSDLLAENQRLREQLVRRDADINALVRKVTSLRGVITRMKSKTKR